MAAKPIERFVKKQIAEQGGWDRIVERIASGETVADVARGLKRPDGLPPSRNFVSMLLHADPQRSARVKAAHLEGASAMVDDAIHRVETAQADRDSTNLAKVQAEFKLKVAGLKDREQWGEAKQQVNVQVNVEGMHLDALRHRQLNKQTVAPELSSGTVVHAPETQELAVVQEIA